MLRIAVANNPITEQHRQVKFTLDKPSIAKMVEEWFERAADIDDGSDAWCVANQMCEIVAQLLPMMPDQITVEVTPQ